MAAGDTGCEAYTAIAWGVGSSLERSDIAGAESFHSLEGNMCGTVMRGADAMPQLALVFMLVSLAMKMLSGSNTGKEQ